MKWPSEVVARLCLLSHGANWAVWLQSENPAIQMCQAGLWSPLSGAKRRGYQSGVQSHHTVGKLATTALCLLAESSLCENYPRSGKLVLVSSNVPGKPFPGTNMINSSSNLPTYVRWSKGSTGEPAEFQVHDDLQRSWWFLWLISKQWIIQRGSWLRLSSQTEILMAAQSTNDTGRN